jgi:hypothetical protein
MSSENNTATVIVPSPPSQDIEANAPSNANDNNKYRGWTVEFDIALLEEVGNCNAHIPGHKQTTKCIEAVTEALKARGIPFDSARTIQHRWEHLKKKYIKKKANEEATAGMEDFGEEDDPFSQLMEELLEEIKDHEAERNKKKMRKKIVKIRW